uniref:Uncharacterized protein n=1 Tax=Anguilla anguilla TaxID=7936 RepID=A0A0E9RBF9_ANGAN
MRRLQETARCSWPIMLMSEPKGGIKSLLHFPHGALSSHSFKLGTSCCRPTEMNNGVMFAREQDWRSPRLRLLMRAQ